jgi:hypothetical protein
LGWGGSLGQAAPQAGRQAPWAVQQQVAPRQEQQVAPRQGQAPTAGQQTAPVRAQRRARLAVASGFWTRDEVPWHITRKELVAVRLSVQHFLPQLAGRRVLLREDNMAVVHILTSLVSRSPVLMEELRRLWYVLDAADIELRPLYIRSAENVIADWASRLAFSGDYMLRPSAAARLQAEWGACTVDAFSSPATALLPRYWTPGSIEGASGTDAFAQPWDGERLWAHPPPSLLPLVAQMLRQMLRQTGAQAIVCAPHWPGTAWFAELLELSSEHVTLPPGALQPIAGDAPARLHAWPVTAFHVPGTS